MIERHFVFEGIEPGDPVSMTDKDGNVLMQLKVMDAPPPNVLKRQAQMLSDAIDAQILEKYLKA